MVKLGNLERFIARISGEKIFRWYRKLLTGINHVQVKCCHVMLGSYLMWGNRQAKKQLSCFVIIIYCCDKLHLTWNLGFPGGSDGREWACNVGDLGSVPGLGRSPGGGLSNPLQCSYLENPHRHRSLAGHSPPGHKELDTTEWLSIHTTKHNMKFTILAILKYTVQ